MTWLDKFRRRMCLTCLGSPMESHPALRSLERTSARLDMLIDKARSISAEMAKDDNPVLLKKPRVPRKEAE